jgi:tRNA G18 (ribose-2'-O)-methylase SpoU
MAKRDPSAGAAGRELRRSLQVIYEAVSDERVETPDDPRVAEYRVLSEPERLRGRGLFVAEGRLVVQRLLESGRFKVRSLLLNAAARAALAPQLSGLAPEIPVYVCPVQQFAAITGFNIHRGCLALVERPPALPFGAVVDGARLLVALEDVANADNMGGVFRNAAAFGADAVLLSPSCCDPLYRKAVRTSMAAALMVPFARVEEWPEGLERLRALDFSIVALTPGEPSMSLDEFARLGRPEKLALVIGAEATGLSAAASALADARVRIPIRREVDSLNLAVAAGIALSRLSRLTGPSNLA